jgi:superfamily II DNA or RNA helicase
MRVERTNEKKTLVHVVHYDDPEFQRAPEMNKLGKVDLAGIISLLPLLEGRNDIILEIVQRCAAEGRSVLVLCDRRAHCEFLHERLGPISGLYYGGANLDTAAQKQVIVGTFSMAQEGLDIPKLDTVILASPHSDVAQAVGRVMRETPGKLFSPVIYDIVDSWSMLPGMFKKRREFYQRSGFEHPPFKGEKHKEPLPRGKCLFLSPI